MKTSAKSAKKALKVAIACGGTGGHLFPGVAVADMLRDMGHQALLILSDKQVDREAADAVDHPVSLYAASKKANELMAHAYAHLYAIPMTGLRFFTVYGPWGRPDMAMWIFAKAIQEGRPIKLFNHGEMRRDFTYIDDVVEALVRLIPLPPRADAAVPRSPATSPAPWRVFNIGNSQPIGLGRLVDVIEAAVGRKAVREMAPMQDGDVKETYADVEDLARLVGFAPKTSIEEGIGRFVAWLEEYERDKALT